MNGSQRPEVLAALSHEVSNGGGLDSGPLIHSFSQLGRLAGADYADLDVEVIKSLVEDVLSGYADCDVDVDTYGEPEAFGLLIGTRGTGIPYPFTSADVYEVVDELSEIFNNEHDDLHFGMLTIDAYLGVHRPS